MVLTPKLNRITPNTVIHHFPNMKKNVWWFPNLWDWVTRSFVYHKLLTALYLRSSHRRFSINKCICDNFQPSKNNFPICISYCLVLNLFCCYVSGLRILYICVLNFALWNCHNKLENEPPKVNFITSRIEVLRCVCPLLN